MGNRTLRKIVALSAPTTRSVVAVDPDDVELYLDAENIGPVRQPDTSTALAATIETIPANARFITESRPATDSTAVYFGGLLGTYHYGPGDITGTGHIVGAFGVIDNKTGGTTVAAGYAVEGRVQATAGDFTFTSSFIAAAQSVTDGAAGAVGIHADFYSPTYGDHAHMVVKYTLLNTDPDKVLQTAGVMKSAGSTVVPRTRVGTAANRYYPIEGVTGLFAGTAATRGTLYASAIVVPDRATYTRIGFTLGTGITSCTARLGLYADSDGMPGDLILDAGTITCEPGDAGTREITISQEMFPGLYWICIQPEGGASDPAITWASVNAWSIIGMSGPTTHDSCALVANTGALPASFGAGSLGGGGFAPFLWLRKV